MATNFAKPHVQWAAFDVLFSFTQCMQTSYTTHSHLTSNAIYPFQASGTYNRRVNFAADHMVKLTINARDYEALCKILCIENKTLSMHCENDSC